MLSEHRQVDDEHSKIMCPLKLIVASSLINREMTKIGQAAWLCGSLPLGCIITYLEKFLLFLKSIDAVPFRAGGCWSQPLVIYIRYTQAKWVVGHVWLSYKMFLLNSSVSFLEYTDRKVVPYLVIVGNPLPNTCLRFWLYTIYVEREMKAFLLDDYYIVVDRHYYNIKRFLI